MEKKLTMKEVMDKTGAGPFQIEYLIRARKLDGYVKQKGKSRSREFKPESIQVIKSWLNKG